MLKFFRHIRQNLIMENKTGKYFKYAIGEIVLVVIGILIALQVNNWNEQRKEAMVLNNYKQRLLSQFQLDSASLSSYSKGYKMFEPVFNRLDSTLHKNHKGMVSNDSIIKIPKWITLQSNFISATYALDELYSTGKMSIIKNDSLKDILSEYTSLIKQQHDIVDRTKNKYDDFDKLLYSISKYSKDINYLIKAESVNSDAFMNEWWLIYNSRLGQQLVYDDLIQTNHKIIQLLKENK